MRHILSIATGKFLRKLPERLDASPPLAAGHSPLPCITLEARLQSPHADAPASTLACDESLKQHAHPLDTTLDGLNPLP
jgi:hypothetical protein